MLKNEFTNVFRALRKRIEKTERKNYGESKKKN